MYKKLFPSKILVLSIILLISCNENNNETINLIYSNDVEYSTFVEATSNFSDTPIIRVAAEKELTGYNYSHMVISYTSVYSEPDLTSEVVMRLSQAQLVNTLEIIRNTNEQGDDISWAKIIAGRDQIGWLPLDNLLELNTSITNFSMNNISNPIISFINDDAIEQLFILDGSHGSFTFNYGMNRILINFYQKGYDFASINTDFEFMNNYWINSFRSMEISVANQFQVFPDYFFNNNQRTNIINNIKFVDSFVFSQFESESQMLNRDIFLTTNDYDIRIRFFLRNEVWDEILTKVISESPSYFGIRTGPEDIEYTEENLDKGWVIWGGWNSIERFGSDLLNNINPSETLYLWFNETEDVLRRFFLRSNNNLQFVELPRIMFVNAPAGLRIRSEPSTSSIINGTLLYGERIIIHERSDMAFTIDNIIDYWYRIRVGSDEQNWIFGGYISERLSSDLPIILGLWDDMNSPFVWDLYYRVGYRFLPNNEFAFFIKETGHVVHGSWEINNDQIRLFNIQSNEGHIGVDYTEEQIKLEIIDDDYIVLTFLNYAPPAFAGDNRVVELRRSPDLWW